MSLRRDRRKLRVIRQYTMGLIAEFVCPNSNVYGSIADTDSTLTALTSISSCRMLYGSQHRAKSTASSNRIQATLFLSLTILRRCWLLALPSVWSNGGSTEHSRRPIREYDTTTMQPGTAYTRTKLNAPNNSFFIESGHFSVQNSMLRSTQTDPFRVLDNEGTYSLSTVATARSGAKMARATSQSPARRLQAPRLDGIQGCRRDCVMARYRSTDIAVMVNTLEATATPCKKLTVLHITSPKYHSSVTDLAICTGMQNSVTNRSATDRFTRNMFVTLLMYWNLITMKMSSVFADNEAVSTTTYSTIITTSGL